MKMMLSMSRTIPGREHEAQTRGLVKEKFPRQWSEVGVGLAPLGEDEARAMSPKRGEDRFA
jgi:hypothetical protein